MGSLGLQGSDQTPLKLDQAKSVLLVCINEIRRAKNSPLGPHDIAVASFSDNLTQRVEHLSIILGDHLIPTRNPRVYRAPLYNHVVRFQMRATSLLVIANRPSP